MNYEEQYYKLKDKYSDLDYYTLELEIKNEQVIKTLKNLIKYIQKTDSKRPEEPKKISIFEI